VKKSSFPLYGMGVLSQTGDEDAERTGGNAFWGEARKTWDINVEIRSSGESKEPLHQR